MICDLSRFTHLGSTVQVVRTSPDQDLAALPPLPIANGRFTTVDPPRSVTTFVIDDAVYDGPRDFDPQAFYTIENQASGRPLEQAREQAREAATAPDARPPSTSAPLVTERGGGHGRGPCRGRTRTAVASCRSGRRRLHGREPGLRPGADGHRCQRHFRPAPGAPVGLLADRNEGVVAPSNQHWRLVRRADGAYSLVSSAQRPGPGSDPRADSFSRASTMVARRQQWQIAPIP